MDEVRGEVREYLRQNMGIYIFIISLLVLGVLLGGLAVRGLNETQMAALDQYLCVFIESFKDGAAPEQGAVFRQSLRINFQYLLLTWILGIFILGFPVICCLVVVRGFSLGFTVGFLVERASLSGVFFAMGSVLPHNLVIIPALIVLTVTGFSFSWLRFRSHLEKRPCSLREHIGPYTVMNILLAMILFGGVLVEAYISPVFVRLLVPFLQ